MYTYIHIIDICIQIKSTHKHYMDAQTYGQIHIIYIHIYTLTIYIYNITHYMHTYTYYMSAHMHITYTHVYTYIKFIYTCMYVRHQYYMQITCLTYILHACSLIPIISTLICRYTYYRHIPITFIHKYTHSHYIHTHIHNT